MITPLFHVGQRVTCTNGDFTILLAQNPGITVPVADNEYIIRRNLQFTHDVGVLLQEVNNVPIPGSYLEPNFSQFRFRAAQELPAEVMSREVCHADTV